MDRLRKKILDLDGQPIQKYSAIVGSYTCADIGYHIRNVYGGPSKKCSVEIKIPRDRLYKTAYEARDLPPISFYISRDFYVQVKMKNEELRQSDSSKQKGYFCAYPVGQRVLPNTVVSLDSESVKIKLEIKLPVTATSLDGSLLAMNAKAAGNQLKKRKKDVISARALGILLLKNLPALVESFLEAFSEEDLFDAVMLYRNQTFLRAYLKANGYVAFLGNGAILPRKGLSDYKNPFGAKAFQSPPSRELEIKLPDGSLISGLGIKEGITVILGDAYQGKSTLLSAIYEGIYNHVVGDGREYVISCESALHISAETGRSVQNTDISFYLKNLPQSAGNARNFSTGSASGSTSQAASVAEAVESGCKLMLFNEDTCANNFMYKEKRMREIFKNSTTVPFMDHVRTLYTKYGVSSILAVGASAEYLSAADCAFLINDYRLSVFESYEKAVLPEEKLEFSPRTVDFSRFRVPEVLSSIAAVDGQTLRIGNDCLSVANLLRNPSEGQMKFLVFILKKLFCYDSVFGKTLPGALDVCYAEIDRNGGVPMDYAGEDNLEYVRKQDVMQILYRCRKIKFKAR